MSLNRWPIQPNTVAILTHCYLLLYPLSSSIQSSSQNVILVTGATGSVGSATLDSLTQVSCSSWHCHSAATAHHRCWLSATHSIVCASCTVWNDSCQPPTSPCALKSARRTRRTTSRSTTHKSPHTITPPGTVAYSATSLDRSHRCGRSGRRCDRVRAVQAEFALIDYDDIDSVFSALKGVTTLFIVTPYTYKQLVIARLLVDAAKAAGTTYIVHLGVSQPEKSAGDYIAWHLLTEKYIEASGVKWVHLRPNMFLDNLQEYGNIHTFQNGTLTFPLKPDLKLPWVTTEDIGAVSAAVLVNPSQYASQVIPITSELNSVHGVVQAIQQVRDGKPVKLDTPSTEQFYKQLVDAGGDPAYFHGFKVNVDEHNQLDDATKAWGAKEGLDAVRSIAKKEPMTSSEWARKYKETFAQ